MSRWFTQNTKRHRQALVIVASVAMLSVGGAVLSVGGSVHAQSGTRIQRGTVRQIPGRAASPMRADRGNVGLQGYCPVCVIKMKKWVKGSPAVQANYDGKTYYFPAADQRAMFLADPAKYVPALGGDCVVCLAKMGKRMPGSIYYSAIKGGRLFLFPGKDQQQEFISNTQAYADVDLAYGGNCVVCRVEMNKDVPGKPEIAAYYQGMRYLFPSDKQRSMFLSNPAKYAATPARTTQTSFKAATQQMVTFVGKSGCAGCDYGVKPIGAPDELGLAVKTADGRVYVVENAHTLYAKIYEGRFDGLSLEVSGQVLKREGNIVWVQPASLKVVN